MRAAVVDPIGRNANWSLKVSCGEDFQTPDKNIYVHA